MNDTTDWFTVERIAQDTRQITEGQAVLPCNMFVVDGGDETLLIDTGLGIGDLRAMVESIATGDVRVLLTHSHWDHIGAAHQFDNISINDRERSADGTVSLDVLEDGYSQRPRQFMSEWLETGEPLPEGFDPETYGIKPTSGVDGVSPGDVLEIGDKRIELIPVPGHTPGQLAALDRESGILHAADVIEPGGEIFAHFKDADLEEYSETIDRLIDLHNEGAFDTMTIGHGDPIRGDDLSILNDIKSAFENVIEGTISYELIDTPWGTSRKYTTSNVEVLTPNETFSNGDPDQLSE